MRPGDLVLILRKLLCQRVQMIESAKIAVKRKGRCSRSTVSMRFSGVAAWGTCI
jgi:hypothetical protein